MAIDKARIESIAVDTVNMYISENTANLSGELAKSDTGISVDGEVIFYSSQARKVSTFGGTIPVQVKGTEVSLISKGKAAFRKFDLDTFRNFLKLNGVLVFLVEEIFLNGKVKEKQIFYKYLDASFLIDIINRLSKKDGTYRTIYLDKLSDDIDFDDEIDKIRITRGSMPPGLALYKARNNDPELINTTGLQDFIEIVEGVTKEVKDSEFYDDSSVFLQQAISQINNVLSQDFLFDYEDAVLLASIFVENKKYMLLQKNTKNKVLIFLAKVSNYRRDFDEAKRWLESVTEINESDLYFYHREIFVANTCSLEESEAMDALSKWERKIDKDLYKFYYEIENKLILNDDLEKIEENSVGKDDYLYLIGMAYSNNREYKQAARCFEKIKNNRSAQAWKIINYFRGTIDEILWIKNPEKIKKLATYGQELQEYLNLLAAKQLDLSEGSYIHQLIESIIKPEKFIGKELGTSREQDTAIIQALLVNEEFATVVEYLKNYGDLDFSMTYFLLVALSKKNDFSEIVLMIESIYQKSSDLAEDMKMLLEDFYIDALIRTEDITRVENLSQENLNMAKVHQLRILLFKLETNGAFTNTEFNQLQQIIDHLETDVEFKILNEIIFRYDNFDFVKQTWNQLRESHSDYIVEAICKKMLKNGDQESLLYLLDVFKWYQENKILKDELVIYELQAYYFLEQYKALARRVNQIEHPDDQALNLLLISKIKLKDQEDIEKLLETASMSENQELKLNAGIGYIAFRVDPIRGSKILLREIIESDFQNEEMGRVYVMQRFDGLRDLDDEKELSNFAGKRLYYYELMSGKERREIIVIPKDWKYPLHGQLRSITPESRESVLLRSRRVDDAVVLGKKSYRIIQKIPISRYVHNRMVPVTVGPPESDKPMKSFDIDIEKNDFSEIVEFLEQNNKQKQEAIDQMQKLRFTGFVQHLGSYDEVFNLFATLLNDEGFVYSLGRADSIFVEDKMQLSLSSLVVLENYDIGDIVKLYPNLAIDKEIPKHIEHVFEIESNQGYDLKKFNVYENQPYITERTEEEYQKQLEYLTNLLQLTDNIRIKNEAAFIHPKYKEIFEYDACSIQSAIDHGYKLIIEDCVMQQSFNGISVLGLVHEAFIKISPDIGRYMDFLLKLEESNNEYEITHTILTELAQAAASYESTEIFSKLERWIHLRLTKNMKNFNQE